MRLIVILSVLTSLVSVITQAQSQNIRARALFRSGKSDAMRVLILKQASDGSLVPAAPNRTFQKGDQIRIAFESNFDGFVYIVNVTPGGKKLVLFPYAKETNRIINGQHYELPSDSTFIFDEEKGIEIVQVIMSREPIQYLDDAIKNSQGELGKSASSAAAELTSSTAKIKTGIVAENITIVLPQTGPGAVRTRGIILAPGKDKDREGSFIAIPDKPQKAVDKTKKNGADGRLQPGEVAVFEIRLEHI
ncbi:MAG: DUF4384 domain-containing protein [Acidobacteriota bacterium]